MKKTKIGAIICTTLAVMMCIPCYARGGMVDFDEISENAKNVTINVNVPEGFNQRVDVYLDKSAHGITANENYSITIPVEDGTYNVNVIFPSDVEDKYIATVQKNLDVHSDTTLTVNVSENTNRTSNAVDNNNENANVEGVYEDFELDDEVAEYDYSDGKESGTIHIKAKNYGVFDSITYRLVGEKVYDIKLENDFGFEANVTLPVGKYYETGTMSYELCDWVPENSDITFKWEHKDNVGAFGNYYTIDSGTTVEDTDLIVYMLDGNDSVEVSANQLNNGKVILSEIEAQQAHENEKLKEIFPEDFESESETETIPTVEITEAETSIDFVKIIQIATVVALGAIVGAFVYFKKKK